MKRDFLTLADLTPAELNAVIEHAIVLKNQRKVGASQKSLLEKRSVALIFEKPSTRTRVSFEVAVHELGGYPVVLSPRDMQLGRGESIADTARTLSRYVHAIVIRTFAQVRIEELARNARVPVVNALTDEHHPCQVLADLMTVRERRGKLLGLRYAWVGDGNNVARSWAQAAMLLGLELRIASPRGYGLEGVGGAGGVPGPAVEGAQRNTPQPPPWGPTVSFTRDPAEAVDGADVVITDVWASMGQEGEAERRRAAFEGYTVDGALMAKAGVRAMVLHCLPAHRGEEIAEEYLDGPDAAVWDEAENRLHAQKALLAQLFRH